MTELPFCLQPSKISDNNDYESYKKGEFELEEWEDVNYCEHSFSYGDKGLTDREVVDLLNELHEENNELKSRLCDCHTFLSSKTMVENSNEELRKENEQLKLKIDGLEYALKNIKRIDVEIDLNNEK